MILSAIYMLVYAYVLILLYIKNGNGIRIIRILAIW
jgi:hypothetical protein